MPRIRKGPEFNCEVRLMDINELFPSGLNVYDAIDLLRPVVVYILGIAVYAVFVFNFYRFVATRDMFLMDLSKYQESRFRWVRAFLQILMYVIKYLIVFPVFAFLWFATLTLILTFLSKEQSFTEILLMALATVSAIRVTSYYNEALSTDLAKILPFAVLGIFVVNTSFFTVSDSLDTLLEAEGYMENILYYLGFLIALEFALRIIFGVAKLVRKLGGALIKAPSE